MDLSELMCSQASVLVLVDVVSETLRRLPDLFSLLKMDSQFGNVVCRSRKEHSET